MYSFVRYLLSVTDMLVHARDIMTDNNRLTTMYQVCLLHSRTDRSLRMIISRHLEQFNITMMEWLLMEVVSGGPREGMTMSGVAAALDVTLPQVTALTASLTKVKLLKQKVSRRDRRSRHLVCTPVGQQLLHDVEADVNTAMTDWVADIPRPQLGAYMETIRILANRKPHQA
jgi:DNA-binding MarR family transcriptional regulator